MLVPFFSAARVRKTEQSSIYFLMKSRAFAREQNSLLLKYLKRANRPKGRDAKLWGLMQILWVCDDSPAANISIILIFFKL